MRFTWGYSIIGIAGLGLLLGCENLWDEHFSNRSETVDENVWAAVQQQNDLSVFVQYMKQFSYDTLFLTNNTYTLFIPSNDAFAEVLDTGSIQRTILEYHLSPHFIQSGNIKGAAKLQTLGEKFVIFERTGSSSLYDGIPLAFESPLYLNGKYFILDQVALPRPNLYEFFSLNNPVLKNYIDDQDSIILDKEKSRPTGFDSLGNTIYDTVSDIYNIFEAEFFPVSEEFRYKTATIVFPLEEDYNAALTAMAERLGGSFIDYNDIPIEWQNEVLIPHLLNHGVFQNQLEELEFMFRPGKDSIKLKNIQGDSVVVTYQPVNKAICSNGYAYNYEDFTVPDSLYVGASRFEGEWLLKATGYNKYAWLEEVTVISDGIFEPKKLYWDNASNDTVLYVLFLTGYDRAFTLEFKTENIFPGTYHMIVNTHMDIGGIYDIYINDEFVMTIDYGYYIDNHEVWYSCAGGRFFPDGRLNRFDACDLIIQDFGALKVRFEYKGPGKVGKQGLVIDYIEFNPVED